PDSIEKISKIDEHIGVATSGLVADSRKLVYEARIKAQSYWLTYEEQVPGEAVAEHICDVKAEFTQGGGARPYGVSMIIGSVDTDSSPRLFVTDPVGTYWGFLAAAIGRGTTRAGDFLQKNYSRSAKIDEAIGVGLGALREATEKELNEENVEIARVPKKTRVYEKLNQDEVKTFLSQ
ncbi:proteasome subunit alpha, partial [Candidatus Thorarchaeota archaeon]